MKYLADLQKLLSDFWSGKGRFSKLGRIPPLRCFLASCAIVAVVMGGWYKMQYEPVMRSLWKVNDVEQYVKWRDSLRFDDKQNMLSEFSLKMKSITTQLEISPDIAELMTSMTKLAEQNKVEFATITPMSPRESDEYSATVISLVVRAGYRELVHFIRKLEESDRFINITSIQAVADNSGTGKLNVTFMIELYHKTASTSKNKPAGKGS